MTILKTNVIRLKNSLDKHLYTYPKGKRKKLFIHLIFFQVVNAVNEDVPSQVSKKTGNIYSS